MGVADAEIARSHLASLPPFPDARPLLAIASAADWVRKLADEIEFDAAATRALYLLSANPTGDVRAVIESLGPRAVSIVLISRLYRHLLILQLERGKLPAGLNAMVRHSIAVGLLAERLEPQHGGAAPALLLAGAAHDIGKLALAALYPKSYERFLCGPRADARQDLAALESRLLGIDHAAAGATVASAWGFPGVVVESIRLHHFEGGLTVASPEHGRAIALVRVANAALHRFEKGRTEAQRPEDLESLAAAAGVQAADVERCAESLDADVERWLRAFEFEDVIEPERLAGWAAQTTARYARRLAPGDGARSATPADRILAALQEFDAKFNPRGGLGAVAALILHTAAAVWQDSTRAAIAAVGDVVAVAAQSRPGQRSASIVSGAEPWAAWFAGHANALRMAHADRRFLRTVGLSLDDSEESWIVPIRRGDRVSGVLILAECQGPVDPAAGSPEADALLSRFGAALADAAAHAQAQRLADDLMETNRRLQHSQGEILRSRALSMIAEMASGAGHELNNPLSVISGRAELLLRDVDPDSELHRALAQIQARAHDCSRIVSQMMDFAIPRPPTFAECTAAMLFETLRGAWRDRVLPANVRLDFELDRSAGLSPRVARADAAQLAAAVAELIQNGLESMVDRPGAIRVLVRHAAGAAPPEAAARGDAIEISVGDAGCGMSASVLQRAFDPFFSHRAAGRGRGLGLARAYRVVESHGGRIWLESRPGDGTRACIEIPLLQPTDAR